MSPITILVKEPSAKSELSAFASRVSAALEDCVLTERESSNFAHGHYFKGKFGNAEIELYYLDTEGLEQYLFAVEISATPEVVHKAAGALVKAGFPCFVPVGAWYRKSWDGQGKIYEF